MKALVIYDSLYGNTEKVAKAVAKQLGQANVVHAAQVKAGKLSDYDLIIVGSPVHGGRATPAIQNFLSALPKNSMKGIKVTSFDTRIAGPDIGIGLKIITGILGYAAGRIAKTLATKGGEVVAEPMGFIVQDKEGPLKRGEIERASNWAKSIASN